MGRRIWTLDTYEGQVLTSGPFRVLSIKQFLPAGRFVKQDYLGSKVVSERKRSLVQVWTDHGVRTVAVAGVWTKDPAKASSPW